MTPKIVTRLANIAAKLAGSDKYDPTIEPVTAFEYYLNKGVDKILAIKGVPAVEVSDKGKVLSVSDSGAPAWEDKGPLVVTFSGTTAGGDATCNKTWAEIQAAGDNIRVIYNNGRVSYLLTPKKKTGIGSLLEGTYLYIEDPADIVNSFYVAISCTINSEEVFCKVTEHA